MSGQHEAVIKVINSFRWGG